MDVERSSLCNCVVNFLLEENYLLTAFELLHQLHDDGRDAQAIRLKDLFSNSSHFPPDQISRFNSLRGKSVADPQSLLEEKEALEEKLALSEYELRLSQEDILKLKDELLKKTELAIADGSNADVSMTNGSDSQQDTVSTAMTFYEEVVTALDWSTTGHEKQTVMQKYNKVPRNKYLYMHNGIDALRHYYYQYLSSTAEAAEVLPETHTGDINEPAHLCCRKKIAMLRENESLQKENEPQRYDDTNDKTEALPGEILISFTNDINGAIGSADHVPKHDGESRPEDNGLLLKLDSLGGEPVPENVGLETIQTLAEALPKIVPYVLINHREINHMYKERKLLVAQSCGKLVKFVRPEIRDSLILSIMQQLIEDSATVVREAAAHNLALLLPLFPNMDKNFKVEEMMFQLVCDPSGVVVETTIKDLAPALINWGDKLDNMLRVLLSHIISSAQEKESVGMLTSYYDYWQNCFRLSIRKRLRRVHFQTVPKKQEHCFLPPCLNSTQGKLELTQLLHTPIPIPSIASIGHKTGPIEWPVFEWLYIDCFPNFIQLAYLLPQKEDTLRSRITKFLLAVSERFGDDYLTHIMLPVILGGRLKPKTAVAERLSAMCILPLLLAGVLGSPSKHGQLTEYLRNLLIQSAMQEGQPTRHAADIINPVCFLCTFEEHHDMIFNILWEMVVSSNINMKISAANLLKVSARPYIDAKEASTHVVPALVTLGSDQTLNVKYASIDAFGAVAQHFKNDMIFQLTNTPLPSSDVMRRRDRANAFCESIRALDATEFYVEVIYAAMRIKKLLKSLLKERGGGTFEAISKVMGAHLGLTSSVSSFFGESGLLGKKETCDPPPVEPILQPTVVEDTRFRRIMRVGFTDMLRGKAKCSEETPPSQ
ncbi:HEAT repeat-containing protein [Actinidia rufa]|uniref:HEAT repeat-containing protein n=1 Tax=Actinidia rufa TaxID=165716 RepID=A0A7J0H826_9ERIC|nr:HEAT repeat-containing protein [Actinidia rufa]